MIAELSKPDQSHLIKFFKAMTKQDGEKLGSAILDMSEKHTCKVMGLGFRLWFCTCSERNVAKRGGEERELWH